VPSTSPPPDDLDTTGPNAWLVDEMQERWQRDPDSVGPSWREFFSGAPTSTNGHAVAPPATNGTADVPMNGAAATAHSVPQPAMPNGAAPAPATGVPSMPTSAAPSEAEPLRGAAARIVTNMEASLAVPTATSFREVPTKLLEVNRKSINGFLSRSRAGRCRSRT